MGSPWHSGKECSNSVQVCWRALWQTLMNIAWCSKADPQHMSILSCALVQMLDSSTCLLLLHCIHGKALASTIPVGKLCYLRLEAESPAWPSIKRPSRLPNHLQRPQNQTSPEVDMPANVNWMFIRRRLACKPQTSLG